MAWIESHQSLQHHHKTVIAADMLGISRVQLIGHLQCLWWWGLDNAAPDGRLGSSVTPRMLAEAAEFPAKKADAFVNALTACGGDKSGFLDLVDGVYFLHDWHDYAGKFSEKKELAREQKRLGGQQRMAKLSPEERSELAKKAIKSRWDTSRNTSTHLVGDTSSIPADIPGTVPNQPNQTNQDNLKPPIAPLTEESDGSSLSLSAGEVMVEKNVYQVWEDCGFEKLTEFSSHNLRDAVGAYTEAWVIDALKEAAKHGKRTWAYVEGTLKNWKTEGRDVGPPDKSRTGVNKPRGDPDKYIKGKYGHIVQR